MSSPGLSLREAVVEALDNLRAHRQRSLLALLGILIGTASIVAMLTIGHMAQLETLRMYRHLGVDIVQVHAAQTGLAPATIDRGLAEALPGRDPRIRAVASMGLGRFPVAFGDQISDLSVAPTTQDLARMTGMRLAQGRFLAPIDDGGLSAVVGSEVARKLSAPGRPLRVGEQIRVGGYVYRVIGVLAPMPFTSFDPVNFNETVQVPIVGGQRLIGVDQPSTVLVRMAPDADIKAAAQRLTALLARPGASLQVLSAREMIDGMNAQKAIHSRLLTAIGAISLLVGGIGVMNVMLMGVMERRREIGLRSAIGATPRDLQLMFLIEAATLASVGGVAGLLAGLAAAGGAAVFSGWAFAAPLYVLVLGPAMAALVGVAFGFYPARKASRLDPIEALRAE
ncbi:MAG: ABC transporter permease [Caulobacter sp.]|nr:ABC transporter permease [Caulobacter sp.]